MRPERRVLICANGTAESLPSLHYGMWMARHLHLAVELLAVREHPREEQAVRELTQIFQSEFENDGISPVVDRREGDFLRILMEIVETERDLVILGPLGRPRWRRWLLGRSFREIAHAVQAPLLFVKEHHPRLEKILVCLGGLGYAREAEQLALNLASKAGARVSLLHVVEPVSFEYPTAIDVHAHPGNILESNSPQAKNLRAAISMAQEAGIAAHFIERSGNVIHEILAELDAGGYDLAVLGTSDSSQSLRNQFRPNVMAQVAESCSLPILVVRAQQTVHP